MAHRRSLTPGQDPNALSYGHRYSGQCGCNSSCLYINYQKLLSSCHNVCSENLTLGASIMATPSLAMCLLTAVASYMCGAGLAKRSAMSTLRDWTTLWCDISTKQCSIMGERANLLVDVLQRSIRMLAVANPMTSHTCLTGILFALDQHLGVMLRFWARG